MDALNEASANSVQSAPASSKIPSDGTGEYTAIFCSGTMFTNNFLPGVVQLDPYLEPFTDAIKRRYATAQSWINTINQTEGGLEKFSRGYERYGFLVSPDNTITYREWAPNALRAYLIGDFNGWNRDSHEMKKNEFGVFEIVIPPKQDGSTAIDHDSKVKISLVVPNDGQRQERVPAWIKRVTQDLNVSPVYDARFYNPPHKYQFKNPPPPYPKMLASTKPMLASLLPN